MILGKILAGIFLMAVSKRGVTGSNHKISRKYLPLYVAEFHFHFSNEINAYISGEAIRGC